VAVRSGDSEAFRREMVARIPRWYVPWVHLVGPSLVGVPLAAFALSRVRSPRGWELLSALLFFVFANLVEWVIHRDVLHHRVRFLEIAFVRHTPQHHGAFDGGQMAIHDPRELKLVLLPAFGVIAMFAFTLPPGLALAALVSPNVGALWVAVGVAYVLAYEWFHLSYHLPEDSVVGRLALVRVLRRHHALHHTAALMQRANFNVTLPLWDWLLGTLVKEPPPAPAPSVRR
jgi:sterol desaturase/sphingolipid hydroxylase (fatty acid hydroxylase superfamily)